MKTRTCLWPSKKVRPLKFKKQESGLQKIPEENERYLEQSKKYRILFVAVVINVCTDYCAKKYRLCAFP
jgi:hypothetical protein